MRSVKCADDDELQIVIVVWIAWDAAAAAE